MIKCALFDLDGTLVNTIDDLSGACEYVLKEFNIKSDWTIGNYTDFVGNGARVLVDRAFNHTLSDKELDKAYSLFKERYNQILLDNAYVYDGIKEQLDLLKDKGIKLAVVTNKPDSSAKLMINSLFGDGYFDFISGAEDNRPKKPDPYTTMLALDALGCKSYEAIFFGDSDIDIQTAENSGVKSVGCSWGFRSYECLMSASPYAIIERPEFIFKLF